MQWNKTLQFLIPLTLFCGAAHGATVFNFDNDTPGTATGFTDTVSGVSATFSTTVDPGGFVIYPSIFETLTGNVLGDPGPAGIDRLSLSIAFSTNLSAITLDFATADFATASPFTLTALEGSTEVGSTTMAGSFLPGFSFPEGEIAFSHSSFNNVRLSSTALDFAVDNISILPITTPEPASLALFGCGLCAVGLPLLDRRARSRRFTDPYQFNQENDHECV